MEMKRLSDVAAYYDRYADPPEFSCIRNAEYEFVLGSLRRGDRVVDIGCGKGYWLGVLNNFGCYPIGIDLSPKSLKLASVHGPVIIMSADNLGFCDSCFDGALLLGHVLGHLNLEERNKAIRGVHRVLKEDSYLFASFWTHEVLSHADSLDMTEAGLNKSDTIQLHFFQHDELLKLAEGLFEMRRRVSIDRRGLAGREYAIELYRKV